MSIKSATVFLLLFSRVAFGFFSNCEVIYDGTSTEKEALKKLVDNSLVELSSKSKTSVRLGEIVDTYLSEYKKMIKEEGGIDAKIIVSYGKDTRFSPANLMSSPSKASSVEGVRDESEQFMNRADELSKEITRKLKENSDLIFSAFCFINGREPKSSEKLKFQYNSVKKDLDKLTEDYKEKTRIIAVIDGVVSLEKEKESVERDIKLIQQEAIEKVNSKKCRDLFITIGQENFKNYFTPGCLSVKDNGVLIAPTVTPFSVVLAHELIHMKHYLEEQIFKKNSLEIVAESVFSDSQFSDLNFESKDKALSMLIGNSSVRARVFDSFQIVGDGNLIWKLRKLDQLPSLAYSVAGITSGSDDIIKSLLPEGESRESTLLLDFVKDLEERRTVLGGDRDNITENAIRMDMGLPLRYIYQTSLTPMIERSETIEKIFGKGVLDYITKNSHFWPRIIEEDFAWKNARSNGLTAECFRKAE